MEAVPSRRTIASIIVTFVGIVALAVAAISTFAGAGQEEALDQHCPGMPGHPNEIGSSGGTLTVDGHTVLVTISGSTVDFTEGGEPIVVDFCMKAATDNSGVLTGSTGAVDWLNPGGQTPDISYVVVYGVPPTTTTTTEAPTTTTVAPTTTTVAPTTTTAEVSPTTVAEVEGQVETTTTTEAEVKGVVVQAGEETPRAAPEELAFTGVGNSTALFVALGVVLISFGIGLAWAGRRETALVHHDR